jgi:tRNA threonylcarbamoyladenosine dehydratase
MNDDYRHRFGGLARLYGEPALARLHAAHVAVVGVGGVGSWAVEALARSGIGALTLIDLDDVCLTNVNRQLPALDGNIGRPKIDVLADRVRAINPACRVAALAQFFTAGTAERLLASRYDVVIDAIDGTQAKATLIAACVRHHLRCVTVGGAGGKRDGTQVRTGDLGEAWGDQLLRLVRQKLRRHHGFASGEGHRFGVRCVFSPELPVYPWSNGTCAAEPEPGGSLKLDCASGFGTAVFVTATFGFVAAQEAVRWVLDAPREPDARAAPVEAGSSS